MSTQTHHNGMLTQHIDGIDFNSIPETESISSCCGREDYGTSSKPCSFIVEVAHKYVQVPGHTISDW